MKRLGLSLIALLVLQIALLAAAANSASVKFDETVAWEHPHYAPWRIHSSLDCGRDG